MLVIPKSLKGVQSLAEFWTNCGKNNAADISIYAMGKPPLSPKKC